MKYLSIVLFILGYHTVLPADTLGLAKKFGLDYSISGGHYYHAGGNGQGLGENEFIKDARINNLADDNYYFFYEQWDTDCPLYHGAVYLDFKGRLKGYGFDLNADITAEHRGISYGVFNTENMIVYPRVNLAFDTTLFTILGGDFRAGVNVGNYDRLKLYEGLNFYNLDAQGSYFFIQWDKFRFAFQRYGDLEFGYGIGIGDSDDWILSANGIEIYQDIKADIQAGLFNYLTGSMSILDKDNYSNGETFSVGIYNDNTRIYGQYALRGLNEDYIDSRYRSAVLVGASHEDEFMGVKFDALFEYRYYGFFFNEGFITPGELYRKDETEGIGNTIGEYLYPLYVFERPFSQWAVFTEYQNMNVYGLTFRLNAEYFIYEKIKVFYDLDYNYIRATNMDGTEFPFYNAGIAYEPIPGNYIAISQTNKTMNLNLHYPAFYMYENPAIQLTFKFDIGKDML